MGLISRARSMVDYSRGVRDYIQHRRMGGARAGEWRVVTGERTSTHGIDAHYFYQDAWCLRRIRANAPSRHVDVASRIDTVAHMSILVPTESVEYRPLPVTLPDLTPRRGTIVDLPYADQSVPSLSCLHVVEHIGLGRYGDPVDPEGTKRACAQLARILAPGGRLYVGLPVGRERIVWNAHRVHDPRKVAEMFPGLRLENFGCITDKGEFIEKATPDDAADATYACGLYEFTRAA